MLGPSLVAQERRNAAEVKNVRSRGRAFSLETGGDTTIHRFRGEVAVRGFPLPVLERLKHELDEPGWNRVELTYLREELRGLFDVQLMPYPVIQTNPFS